MTAALAARAELACGNGAALLIFNDETGEQVDVQLDSPATDIEYRLRRAAAEPRGPGRPRLGVVPREVTLLPRHWDWLNTQPGGASVALRRLVEEARKAGGEKDRVRIAREAAYRFMSAVAGNEPGFEEASRALFAGSAESFRQLARLWPPDVRDYAIRLAAPSFEKAPDTMNVSPHNP
jgi:hypothetical protein